MLTLVRMHVLAFSCRSRLGFEETDQTQPAQETAKVSVPSLLRAAIDGDVAAVQGDAFGFRCFALPAGRKRI